MKCKVSKCNREAMYKGQRVCQKHYFRKMRNGSYGLQRSRKYRIQNPAGYSKVYEPDHFLADGIGYIYEHRFVYYESGKTPEKCEMCGDAISWDSCHIDHINDDITDNRLENLRATCRPCNTFQGYKVESNGKMFLTIGERTLNPSAWARIPGVKVSGATIRRRKVQGASDYDAIYGERKTHRNTKTKKPDCKYDEMRGIR